ncbi:hypothetical protein HID58_003159, partial [Brassica napus]
GFISLLKLFMSLILNQPPKLCLRKPVLVRCSPLHHSNGYSSASLPQSQTLPLTIFCADPCRPHLVRAVVRRDGDMHALDYDMPPQMATNVAMSSSSPEKEECAVAVKFSGPQLSICKPAQSNAEISNPCFFSSPVMYSEKEDMFRIIGSGGHLVGSWDLGKHKSESFCVPACSVRHMRPNHVRLMDVDEITIIDLAAQKSLRICSSWTNLPIIYH